MKRKPQRKAVPLGAPLNTPDEELDMAALVTPEDIEAAKADGRARMDKRGRALLEAERAEQENGDALSLGA